MIMRRERDRALYISLRENVWNCKEKWLQHVQRMEDNTIPKRTFLSKQETGLYEGNLKK
jgi:hypothetical protein